VQVNGIDAEVLTEVAAAGASDAGGLDADLLGDFLAAVAAAVAAGRQLRRAELHRYRARGEEAARRGVPLRALLDLYLSAAWRLWRHLPVVIEAAADPAAVVRAGEAVLRAADDAVAALAEGYQLARRNLVRAQEAARREFIDDLLSGRATVAGLMQRAAGFGLDLAGPHAVAVVRAEKQFTDGSELTARIERAVQGSKADADSLVASKEGLLVVVFAAPDRPAAEHVLDRLTAVLGPRPGVSGGVELRRRAGIGRWQVGAGRPRPGPQGVVASYDEAREAIELADRLGLPAPVVRAADLLIYQVLLRDRTAIADLVTDLLAPLQRARGGAQPLLDTLEVYFESGGNAARTARVQHLSVRAVAYRLARVHRLTGHDPTTSTQRFTLHAAVLGAKLLGWPAMALPTATST
jgi:sugar diacid utilization regulator